MSWTDRERLDGEIDGVLAKLVDAKLKAGQALTVGVQDLERMLHEEEPALEPTLEELAQALWRWNAGIFAVDGNHNYTDPEAYAALKTYEALRKYQPDFTYPFGSYEDAVSRIRGLPAALVEALWGLSPRKPGETREERLERVQAELGAAPRAAGFFVQLWPLRAPTEKGTPKELAQARDAPEREARRLRGLAEEEEVRRLKNERVAALRMQAQVEHAAATEAARSAGRTAKETVRAQAKAATDVTMEAVHAVEDAALLAARDTKKAAQVAVKEAQVATRLLANNAENAAIFVAEESKALVDEVGTVLERLEPPSMRRAPMWTEEGRAAAARWAHAYWESQPGATAGFVGNLRDARYRDDFAKACLDATPAWVTPTGGATPHEACRKLFASVNASLNERQMASQPAAPAAAPLAVV